MARLLADEDFGYQIVLALRALGHEGLTLWEAGLANQGVPDDEVLAHAAALGRILLTVRRLGAE